MTYTVLLGIHADRAAAESEEKAKFIRSVLEALNIETDFWNAEEVTLSQENKIKLRAKLNELGLIILENVDSTLEVWFENRPIGVWEKPNYILKRDLSIIDPKKQLYLEMHVSFSSPLFEASNQSS